MVISVLNWPPPRTCQYKAFTWYYLHTVPRCHPWRSFWNERTSLWAKGRSNFLGTQRRYRRPTFWCAAVAFVFTGIVAGTSAWKSKSTNRRQASCAINHKGRHRSFVFVRWSHVINVLIWRNYHSGKLSSDTARWPHVCMPAALHSLNKFTIAPLPIQKSSI